MYFVEEHRCFSFGGLVFASCSHDLGDVSSNLEEYQAQGYASEAVKAAAGWAFLDPRVKAIEAENEPGNTASQRVLEKCGFTPTGETGKEGPRFILPR